MIVIKSRGGLAHGRGVTLSTQSKVVNTITHTIPICESLEVFSGINYSLNEQYKDLHPTSIKRDGRHFIQLKNYLTQHPPFVYKGEYKNTLIYTCISTGIVAPKVANVDSAVELHEVAANVLLVISIGAESNSTKVVVVRLKLTQELFSFVLLV